MLVVLCLMVLKYFFVQNVKCVLIYFIVIEEFNFLDLQVGVLQKEFNIIVSKYGKMVDKVFNLDIVKVYREVEFDSYLIN